MNKPLKNHKCGSNIKTNAFIEYRKEKFINGDEIKLWGLYNKSYNLYNDEYLMKV